MKDSQFELNIKDSLKESLKNKIDIIENSIIEPLPDDLLDDIEYEIMINLKDIFFRFQLSNTFQDYLKNIEMLEKNTSGSI